MTPEEAHARHCAACDAYLRFRDAGLTMRSEGGLIHFLPASGLTDELRALAVANKPALLEVLAAPHELRALEDQIVMEDFFHKAPGNPEAVFLATYHRLRDGSLLPSMETLRAFWPDQWDIREGRA